MVKGMLAAVTGLVVAVPLLLLVILSPVSPAAAGLGECPPNPAVFPEEHMQPNAVALGRCIARMWPEIKTIGGWRPSDPYRDHPSGQALDVMMPRSGRTPEDAALGNELATWLMHSAESSRVVYVIWRQRTWNYAGRSPHEPITPPGSWRLMGDRGDWTSNHMDHLHIATDGPVALGGQSAPGAGFDGPPPTRPTGAGGFIYPLRNGHIGSEAGWRFHPILHYTRCHAGADMSAPTGTPIQAAADGVVKSAGWNGGYGNFTLIDHGGGVTSGYGHQSRITVHRGRRVRQGQVIGYVGTTGLSTGPHLHFEIRVRGEPYNPRGWIDHEPRKQVPVCA